MAEANEFWEVNEAGVSEGHWLEVKAPDGWYSASVKWDGCIQFARYFNEPMPFTGEHPQLADSLHICDLDEEIKRLEKLREIAKSHFGCGWPEI